MSVEKVSLFMNVPNPIITNLAVGKLYILFSFVSIYRNQTKFQYEEKKKIETSPSTHIFHFPHIIIESFKIPLYMVHIYKNCGILCESYFSNVHINMNV